MPNVTFDAKDIAKLFAAKEFDSLVDGVGMEVEERKGGSVTVSVTPNRPDMLSFAGFMRALGLHSGKARPKTYAVAGKPALSIRVTPAVMRVRPFIAAFVVRNMDLKGNALRYVIDFTEKLSDNYGRKRKKLAMGMHDLDAVKGAIRYDAGHDGRFVPLRGSRAMSFAEILEGHAKGEEYGYTISRNGNADYPFLMDSEKVLSLIPIINSNATRTTARTRSMLVDVTGTDRNAVDDAARMTACMLIDMGAEVLPASIEYPGGKEITPSMRPRRIRVALKDFEETIGVRSTAKELAGIAAREGYIARALRGTIAVDVPPYRTDVLNGQDVIEDLAIAYGYQAIKPIPVRGHSIGRESDSNVRDNGIAMLMVGLGFTEAMNYYLSNERVQFGMMHREQGKGTITVAKSKTESITMLRRAVLPGLLQNLGGSSHERMPQRLFEIGKVFRLESGRPVEETHVAFVSEHSKANFAEAKSVVDALARYTGMRIGYKAHNDGAFIDGRCASFVDGLVGEITPEVLESFKIEEPVIGGEIVLEP
jgi:phenylalanyl-tRNA synthetase beta chain